MLMTDCNPGTGEAEAGGLLLIQAIQGYLSQEPVPPKNFLILNKENKIF